MEDWDDLIELRFPTNQSMNTTYLFSHTYKYASWVAGWFALINSFSDETIDCEIVIIICDHIDSDSSSLHSEWGGWMKMRDGQRWTVFVYKKRTENMQSTQWKQILPNQKGKKGKFWEIRRLKAALPHRFQKSCPSTGFHIRSYPLIQSLSIGPHLIVRMGSNRESRLGIHVMKFSR